MDNDENIVEVKNLSYWYPEQDNRVLKDINLTIKRGELLVLMGASGCGKSTLGLCLNSTIPTVIGGMIKGSVRVVGMDTFSHQVHEMATKVTMVLQDPESQMCNLYVRDEIAFGPQNLCMPRDIILERMHQAMSFVGLEDFEWRSIFGLSGGEKQRVAIASGLVMQPELIIFDEPTANLDPTGAQNVMSLIEELKATGNVSILLIEHNMGEIVHVADRLLVMDEGKIIYDDEPRTLLQERGQELTNKVGLWIPQICQIALGSEEKGYNIGLPLRIEEVDRHQANVLRFAKGAYPSIEDEQISNQVHKEVLISSQKACFTYPDGTEAVRDVSMELRRGSVLAMMGENGSGKSTLCSLFVGLNRPTSGSVAVSGLDAAQTSIRDLAKNIGYVFQYPEHQFVTDQVMDEVMFGLKAADMYTEAEMRERALDILELFGLQLLVDQHPFRLSLGQKRRLSIATMLVLEPEVLILDEPTSGQDRGNVENLISLLKERTDNELTVILVTHDMNLVGRFATDILVMENGSVVFDGKPLGLFQQIEDCGMPASLQSPDTYRLVRKLREFELDVPDTFFPEDFLASLA